MPTSARSTWSPLHGAVGEDPGHRCRVLAVLLPHPGFPGNHRGIDAELQCDASGGHAVDGRSTARVLYPAHRTCADRQRNQSVGHAGDERPESGVASPLGSRGIAATDRRVPQLPSRLVSDGDAPSPYRVVTDRV